MNLRLLASCKLLVETHTEPGRNQSGRNRTGMRYILGHPNRRIYQKAELSSLKLRGGDLSFGFM